MYKRQLDGVSLADALLAPHRTYYPVLAPMLEADLIHGMAHITGGGLQDNVPRVLPKGLGVRIDRSAMPRPPIFDFLCDRGDVHRKEAYRVFNMGFGMVLFVAPGDVDEVRRLGGDEPLFDVGEAVAAEDGGVSFSS